MATIQYYCKGPQVLRFWWAFFTHFSAVGQHGLCLVCKDQACKIKACEVRALCQFMPFYLNVRTQGLATEKCSVE